MNVSISNCQIRVALYTYTTVYNISFWCFSNCLARPWTFAGFLLGLYHTGAPKLKADLTTVLYTCLACPKVAPQVEAVTLWRPCFWLVILRVISLAWLFHLSLVSIQTPRTLTSCFGLRAMPPSWIGADKSKERRLLKWISSYFCGANFSPKRFAHARHRS